MRGEPRQALVAQNTFPCRQAGERHPHPYPLYRARSSMKAGAGRAMTASLSNLALCEPVRMGASADVMSPGGQILTFVPFKAARDPLQSVKLSSCCTGQERLAQVRPQKPTDQNKKPLDGQSKGFFDEARQSTTKLERQNKDAPILAISGDLSSVVWTRSSFDFERLMTGITRTRCGASPRQGRTVGRTRPGCARLAFPRTDPPEAGSGDHDR